MHRCTHSAAGGTIQRLYPGLAIVRLRSRKLISVLIESPIVNCGGRFRYALERASTLPSGIRSINQIVPCVDRAQSVIEDPCGHSLGLYARPAEPAFRRGTMPGRR